MKLWILSLLAALFLAAESRATATTRLRGTTNIRPCDFLLLKAPRLAGGLNATCTVRAHIQPEGTHAYLEAATIGIGPDVLEIIPSGEYSLNGMKGASLPNTVGDGFVLKQHGTVITLDLGVHGSVALGAFQDWVGVRFAHVTGADMEDAVGFLTGRLASGTTYLAKEGVTGTIGRENANLLAEWLLGEEEEPQLFGTKAAAQYLFLSSAKKKSKKRAQQTIRHREADPRQPGLL